MTRFQFSVITDYLARNFASSVYYRNSITNYEVLRSGVLIMLVKNMSNIVILFRDMCILEPYFFGHNKIQCLWKNRRDKVIRDIYHEIFSKSLGVFVSAQDTPAQLKNFIIFNLLFNEFDFLVCSLSLL
jgi:hypothetical protein